MSLDLDAMDSMWVNKGKHLKVFFVLFLTNDVFQACAPQVSETSLKSCLLKNRKIVDI